MSGVNKVMIIGSLGRDPELRHTKSGAPVCRLNIATTRSWTNKQTNEKMEEVEWHRVVAWNKTAEHCNNYLTKGRQVWVEGRLKTTSYEDKDGVKRYSTDIIAERVQFLGKGNQSEANGSKDQPAAQSQTPSDQGQYDAGPDMDDDSIPF